MEQVKRYETGTWDIRYIVRLMSLNHEMEENERKWKIKIKMDMDMDVDIWVKPPRKKNSPVLTEENTASGGSCPLTHQGSCTSCQIFLHACLDLSSPLKTLFRLRLGGLFLI